MDKNLNTRISGTSKRWKKRANENRNNRKNISRAQNFALELMEYMEERGIKQKELAEKMNVSPQQVNKILRAKSNLTFETLDKIASALDIIISSPTIKQNKTAYSKSITTMQVVHKISLKEKEKAKATKPIIGKNPILEMELDDLKKYQYTAEQI